MGPFPATRRSALLFALAVAMRTASHAVPLAGDVSWRASTDGHRRALPDEAVAVSAPVTSPA